MFASLKACALALALLVPVAASAAPISTANPASQPFTIDDYFKLRRIKELSLSSDGKMIAYVTEQQSLEQNKTVRQVFVGAATPGAKHATPTELQDARSLAWIPGRAELAFLASGNGTSQVHGYDVKTGAVRPLTAHAKPIVSFRFAPSGNALAFIDEDRSKQPRKLYDRFREDTQGILIKGDTTSQFDFVDPNSRDIWFQPKRKLWLKQADTPRAAVEVPGSVEDMRWSSNDTRLSVNYIADDVPHRIGSYYWQSLGVVDASTRRFSEFAKARVKPDGGSGVAFPGGEWLAGAEKIHVRRVTSANLWANRSEWAVVDVGADGALREADIRWTTTPEIEERISFSSFIPAADDRLLVEAPVRARRSVFELTSSGLSRARFLAGVKGTSALARFSADFKHAAFVNESLAHPPEIYIWHEGQKSRQVTRLNAELAGRTLPKVKEVNWKSKDGTMVQGWLFEPAGARSKPSPLVTYVHGGPGMSFNDEFAFNFPIWPHPFEAYALNGIAVFMPNYRGTFSFGHRFGTPNRQDGEPIDDIVSGVEHLVAQGVADRERLGIAGHSHGGWLAPLVMTRSKMFRAGSFAEGGPNTLVNYALMPGDTNKLVHEGVGGVSFYDNPARFIETSVDFHLKGLRSATLWEAGSESMGLLMYASSKAAERAGMPTETFIYPKTGHILAIPQLQRESAVRNLDWFRFWLKGEVDADATKADQYARWKAMKRP